MPSKRTSSGIEYSYRSAIIKHFKHQLNDIYTINFNFIFILLKIINANLIYYFESDEFLMENIRFIAYFLTVQDGIHYFQNSILYNVDSKLAYKIQFTANDNATFSPITHMATYVFYFLAAKLRNHLDIL